MRTTADEPLARRSALDLLAALGITSAPIDPDTIAIGAGLEVDEVATGFPRGAYGALVKDAGSHFKVLVSTSCPTRGHRRFTVAHELGHYHIPGHLDVLLGGAAAHAAHASVEGHFRPRRPWWEMEADTFASELLLPSELGRLHLKGRPAGLAAVRDLAHHFDVSLSCAAVRYTELAYDPVLVVLSYEGVVEWSSSSAPVRDHRWARRIGKGEWAPPQSATKILARAPGLVARGEVRFAEGEPLTSWAEGAPPVAVVEEAMGLGEYGRILTVLICENLPTPEREEERERRRDAGPEDWRAGLRPWEWDDINELE